MSEEAFIGQVLEVNGNRLTVFGKNEQKDVPIFTNTRIIMSPKVGDKVLLIRVEGGYVCVGIFQN